MITRIPIEEIVPTRSPPVPRECRPKHLVLYLNSGIRWKKRWVCVMHTPAGEHVGLEEVGEGPWDVSLGPVELARMDERRR
jgi:hypothetical protein